MIQWAEDTSSYLNQWKIEKGSFANDGVVMQLLLRNFTRFSSLIQIVRNKLIYYGDKYKSNILDNPAVFKINKNSPKERLVNLFWLTKDLFLELSYWPTETLESNRIKYCWIATEGDKELKLGSASLGILLIV